MATKRKNPVLHLSQRRHNRSEYLAFSARFHLLTPASLHLSMAYRAINKPTKVSALKFPRRAPLPRFHGAPFNDPTGHLFPVSSPLHGQEKQQLSFNMDGDFSPPLFEALYRLKRGAEQLCHLTLGLSQLPSNMRKLLSVH